MTRTANPPPDDMSRLARDVNEHEAAACRTGDENEAYLADLCRARLVAAERLAVAS